MSDVPLTWGFDPSVNYPAAGEWPTGRVALLHTDFFGPARLADLYAKWTALVREWYRPDLEAVFVERIRGKHPMDALVMASGIIEAATHAVLAELGSEAAIFELSTAEWKAHAVGRGHAQKSEVLRWAQENGYEGEVQDEADALAIACAGGRIMGKGEQVALLG